MLSNPFGIGTQTSQHRVGVLLVSLLAGCLTLVPCFASTNEDLSEPPTVDAATSRKTEPKLIQTVPAPAKPMVPTHSGSAEKTNATTPPATKQPAAGQAPSSVTQTAVPQTAPGKQVTGQEDAEKITAAREKVMEISRRADQLKNESELTLSDSELTISSPRRIQPVDVFLRHDLGVSGQADSPSPSEQSGVSAIELNKIRRQLEVDNEGAKPGKIREKEDATSHSRDEPRPYDLNLRLPRME